MNKNTIIIGMAFGFVLVMLSIVILQHVMIMRQVAEIAEIIKSK